MRIQRAGSEEAEQQAVMLCLTGGLEQGKGWCREALAWAVGSGGSPPSHTANVEYRAQVFIAKNKRRKGGGRRRA